MKKIFCLGLFCRIEARKKKCNKCKTYICRVCTKEIENKLYCPDCYIEEEANRQFKELEKELEEQLRK